MYADQTATRLTVPVSSDDHTVGPVDAPLTLVEYADYQCPYCGEADQTVRQLRETLGDRLRFVYRNFPLVQSHPDAEQAAEAAEAANAQGRFWEMHDLLFQHQRSLDHDSLLGYAQQLGLDVDR